MATKPSLVLLWKHLPDGCTVDITRQGRHTAVCGGILFCCTIPRYCVLCANCGQLIIISSNEVLCSKTISRHKRQYCTAASVYCCRLHEPASSQSASWQLSIISVCNNGATADIIACVLLSAVFERSHSSSHVYVAAYYVIKHMNTILHIIVCLCLVPACKTQCNM